MGRWYGDPSRTRTCNHRLRRSVLYPVELWGRSRSAARSASVRPGQPAPGGEVVAVAVLAQDVPALLRLEDLVGNRMAIGVGDGLLAGRKPQPDLGCSCRPNRSSPSAGRSTWRRRARTPAPSRGSWPGRTAWRCGWAGRSSRAWAPLHRTGRTDRLSPNAASADQVHRCGGGGPASSGSSSVLRGSEGWGGCTHPDDDHFAACTICLRANRATHARV